MHHKFTLLTIFAAALAIVSCKKSNDSTSSGGLVGNWKFLDMKAKTTATSTSGGFTTVTIANYTTQNNAGTAKFTNDSMSVAGMTYSVSTTAEAYIYQGSTFIDSTGVPLNQTVPSITETVSYKLIGSDSISLPNGGFTPTGVPTGQATGGRYTVNKDTLAITINQGGATGIGQVNVLGTVYFLKQ